MEAGAGVYAGATVDASGGLTAGSGRIQSRRWARVHKQAMDLQKRRQGLGMRMSASCSLTACATGVSDLPLTSTDVEICYVNKSCLPAVVLQEHIHYLRCKAFTPVEVVEVRAPRAMPGLLLCTLTAEPPCDCVVAV